MTGPVQLHALMMQGWNFFSHKLKSYIDIPPTRDALLLHSKRAAYPAGFIWSQSTVPQLSMPSPADW